MDGEFSPWGTCIHHKMHKIKPWLKHMMEFLSWSWSYSRQVYLYSRIQQQGYSKCIHTFWDTCWGVGCWMFLVTINNSAQSTCKTCFHIFLISRWICLSVCVSKSFTVPPFEPCCCIMGSQICSHLQPPYSLMWQNVLVGRVWYKIQN